MLIFSAKLLFMTAITTNGAYCFIGKEQVCMNAISEDEVAVIMDACRQWDRPIVMSRCTVFFVCS